eukprot:CAMPEP_0176096798 /NCGR_PEP_ID=MMETSP0120_2-20121206/48526_1 /TAXON_ID=160619 /ORGANISM="Kryptoperidinium foliaceum, Strain CCMP 1326" /LENGTH=83 /DNA_ID=CAMNT_0017430785 /DNA_START=24 /DNA_END=271 /DNA_ORIENTATION=-
MKMTRSRCVHIAINKINTNAVQRISWAIVIGLKVLMYHMALSTSVSVLSMVLYAVAPKPLVAEGVAKEPVTPGCGDGGNGASP